MNYNLDIITLDVLAYLNRSLLLTVICMICSEWETSMLLVYRVDKPVVMLLLTGNRHSTCQLKTHWCVCGWGGAPVYCGTSLVSLPGRKSSAVV